MARKFNQLIELSPTITLAVALTFGLTAGALAQSATPAQVKAAQQKLQAVGLYHGPADGLMDPQTDAAIARFQQQNGLPRSEALDRQTYVKLMSIPTPTPAPTANTAYGSSGPAAGATARPPSASSHAVAAPWKNTPSGASTWQPPVQTASKNTPGGASTWQPPMVPKTKNTPGG